MIVFCPTLVIVADNAKTLKKILTLTGKVFYNLGETPPPIPEYNGLCQ